MAIALVVRGEPPLGEPPRWLGSDEVDCSSDEMLVLFPEETVAGSACELRGGDRDDVLLGGVYMADGSREIGGRAWPLRPAAESISTAWAACAWRCTMRGEPSCLMGV